MYKRWEGPRKGRLEGRGVDTVKEQQQQEQQHQEDEGLYLCKQAIKRKPLLFAFPFFFHSV